MNNISLSIQWLSEFGTVEQDNNFNLHKLFQRNDD